MGIYKKTPIGELRQLLTRKTHDKILMIILFLHHHRQQNTNFKNLSSAQKFIFSSAYVTYIMFAAKPFLGVPVRLVHYFETAEKSVVNTGAASNVLLKLPTRM